MAVFFRHYDQRYHDRHGNQQYRQVDVPVVSHVDMGKIAQRKRQDDKAGCQDHMQDKHPQIQPQ